MFKNLKELLASSPSEDSCRRYMEKARWGDSPFCPHCNATKPYKLRDGKTYRCRSKKCRKDFTVTVGTIFENSKVKLIDWLTAIYLIGSHKKGIASTQLARDLGVTQKTAWFILHRIRYIMIDLKMKPLENIVEIDETYVGGSLSNMTLGKRKKMHELNINNKTAVMGMVERKGKAILTVLDDRSFKEVIKSHVKPASVIITDAHLGYEKLDKEYKGHHSVNHSAGEYKRGIAYTNTVEGFFSQLKRQIYGIHHFVSAKHLQQYCNEVAYRYNSRQLQDIDRFKCIISNVEGRLTYQALIEDKGVS